MADSHQEQYQDRPITHCLLCQEPQECIAVHLARVCMKNETPQKRKKEEWRAKKSMKAWLEKSRVWDYNDICNILPDLTSRRHLVKKLREMGGIVLNEPTEEAANPLQESSTTSTVTLRVPQMSSSQTEAHGFQTETELRDSSTNGSSEHADQTDPAWLTPHQRSSNPRRHRGQRKKSRRK